MYVNRRFTGFANDNLLKHGAYGLKNCLYTVRFIFKSKHVYLNNSGKRGQQWATTFFIVGGDQYWEKRSFLFSDWNCFKDDLVTRNLIIVSLPRLVQS